MRGLINAKYVSIYDNIPPISFIDTLNLMQDYLPKEIKNKLDMIILKKKEGKEKDIEQLMPDFDKFIEQYLNSELDVPSRKATRYDSELQDFIYFKLNED